jgi:hypothetical protein
MGAGQNKGTLSNAAYANIGTDSVRFGHLS